MTTFARELGAIAAVAVSLTACELVFPLPKLTRGTGGSSPGGQAASGGALSAAGGAELTGGAPEGGAGAGGEGMAGQPGSGGVAGNTGEPTAGASGGGGFANGGSPGAAGYAGTAGIQTGGTATAGSGRGGAATGGAQTGGMPTAGTGTGGTATGGTNGCPGTGGPSMVRLPEGYCIDSTEVTRAQYAAWLNTTPPPSAAGQISVCTWNTSFAPYANCHGNEPAGDEYPVCVDWCDAYTYCQAVGKRLCGRIGGGSNAYSAYMNPSLSQWFNACTSHDPAKYAYPNGNGCGACNAVYDEYDSALFLPVGSLSGCQSDVSGYSGVYDLSGNLWEWEDSCNGTTGQTDYCWVRGGNYVGDCVDTRCDIDSFVQRGQRGGIRCCS